MIFFAVILAFILRLPALNQSFWMDEGAQAVLSTKSPFLVNYSVDFQPPLFYILTHFWLKFGVREEWFLRLPSVFFGVITIGLLYYLIKKVADKKAALLAGFFLAISPYHIYYSQEFRMYSFFTFLILLSWIYLFKKNYWIYTFLIAIAIFTHYFGFIVMLTQLIYVTIRQKNNLKKLFIAQFIALLPFVFWIPTFVKQIQAADYLTSIWPKWTESAGVSFVKFLPLMFAKYTVGIVRPQNKFLYAAITLSVMAIFLISVYKTHKNKNLSLLFCYFFIPLGLAWGSSFFISANAPHRLTFLLPAFAGILAIGITTIKDKILARGVSGYLIVIFLLFTVIYLFDSKNYRENWRDALVFTDKRVGESGLVLTESQIPFVPIDWYSKRREKYYGSSDTFNLTQLSIKKRLDTLLATNNHQSTINNIILYTYLFEISDPSREVETYLSSNEFELVQEKDFRGVGIIKIFKKQ